jgi:parallel beta-helix repeat protein
MNCKFSGAHVQKAIRRNPSNANKTVLLALLVLLSTAMVAVFVKPAVAAETIYIRADGSVDPATAPIHVDGNVYTFTDNINDSIVVERDSIVIDGADYTLQGPGGITSVRGIILNGRHNVTIENMKVTDFYYGIVLSGSSNNMIYGIETTGSPTDGIWLDSSNYNNISGNVIDDYIGVALSNSSGNTIDRNNIAGSLSGITLSLSSSNTISRNKVTGRLHYGISLLSSNYNSFYGNNMTGSGAYDDISLTDSNYNSFYGNNILGNGANSLNSTNVWDGGYLSGGNFWSDYNGTDSNGDGIGDTPYVIDASNQDDYPLISIYQGEYSLTVNVVGNGSVTKVPDQASHVAGSVVELTAVPLAGWSFSGWSGDLSGSVNPETVIMNGDKSVTATFHASNTPPSLPQLSITPSLAVKDNDDLVVSVVGPTPPDPDGDIVTYTYRWLVKVGTGSFVDDEAAGRGDHTGNMVPAANTTIGDIWRVEVTPTDEHGAAGTFATAEWPVVVDSTKPVASAGLDQTVNNDTRVTFDGSGSTDNVGIANYVWTFTDVTPQTLIDKNPKYIFATPSTYTVTLNVTDAAGNWATDTVVITVLNSQDTTKPTAKAGPDKLVVEDTVVSFNAGDSSDNIGIVSYEWDFGDKTTGTGITVTHTYTEPGTCTVTLTVKNAAGNSDIDSITVTIQKDTDGDGAPDVTDTDDDNDDMPDVWEIDNGLDPLDAQDASLDSDNDGLTSLQEYLLGKDPNVYNAEVMQPRSLSVVAVAVGAFAAATMAILVNLGGFGKSFDSAISKLPIPEGLKEFIQFYGEKLFETVDKAKLETLEKAPFIAGGEIVALAISALMAMIVFAWAEANGLQNFLNPSKLANYIPSALVSVCVVIIVGELFEAFCARTCKVHRQFRLWMYGIVVFLVSGLVFQLPFGSPGITRYQSGQISKKTKGLFVLSKMLLLLTLTIPFAGLLMLGFNTVGEIGLSVGQIGIWLTLTTVFCSLIPLRPLVGKAVFDYRKAGSLTALVVAGILLFSFIYSVLPYVAYLAVGAVSAFLAAITLNQLRKAYPA